MAKLQDMITQARRAQSGGGMGFLGKNKSEIKPRTTALVVELPQVTSGIAEAAIKAGADGLLFNWDGKNSSFLTTLKQEIDSARASNENLVTGLRILSGWENLDHDSLTQLHEQGIQYVVLPLDAPARLLALETKDIEIVVTVPMHSGDMYPMFIRNLTAFDNVAGVLLDFGFTNNIGSLSIEDILQYRAVREAVRFPALLPVKEDLSEAEAYTAMTLGIQALVVSVNSLNETTRSQIRALRELQEKIHQEEKDASSKK